MFLDQIVSKAARIDCRILALSLHVPRHVIDVCNGVAVAVAVAVAVPPLPLQRATVDFFTVANN